MVHPDTDNLQAHSFEALIAFAATLASVIFFTTADIQRTVIGQVLHPYDFIWNALYGLGGVLIVLGLAYPARFFFRRLYGKALELGGLCMLSSAVLVNLIASLIVVGLNPGQGTLLAVMVACGLRAQVLITGTRRYTTVQISGEDS